MNVRTNQVLLQEGKRTEETARPPTLAWEAFAMEAFDQQEKKRRIHLIEMQKLWTWLVFRDREGIDMPQ